MIQLKQFNSKTIKTIFEEFASPKSIIKLERGYIDSFFTDGPFLKVEVVGNDPKLVIKEGLRQVREHYASKLLINLITPEKKKETNKAVTELSRQFDSSLYDTFYWALTIKNQEHTTLLIYAQ
jgi:hypothetical protein